MIRLPYRLPSPQSSHLLARNLRCLHSSGSLRAAAGYAEATCSSA